MVIGSGQIPYAYENGQPFRQPAEGIQISYSGVTIEDAQFAHTAEHRQLFDSTFLPDWYAYRSFDLSPPSGTYEPQPGGATLANPFMVGSATDVGYILDLRKSLNFLFHSYSVDSNYTSTQHRTDWFSQIYPESPSGQADPGIYLHRAPSHEGFIVGEDADVIATSGYLFDIDYAEVMWNPYPFLAQPKRTNAHGNHSNGTVNDFQVPIMPMFPNFMRTDAGLVTHTGREPSSLAGNDLYRTDHVASGFVRIDGYALGDFTDVFLGQMSDGGIKYTNAPGSGTSPGGDFGYGTAAPRTVGSSGVDVDFARIFVTPSGTFASGVYAVAARNRREHVRTAVESGIISRWPNNDEAFPLDQIRTPVDVPPIASGGMFFGGSEGFEVFNDALWILDFGNITSLVNAQTSPPSGLCAISPHTGKYMWLRYADLEKSTGDPGFAGNPAQDWSQHTTLVRIPSGVAGTPEIIRLHQRSPSNALHMADMQFQIYDEHLNFIREEIFSVRTRNPNFAGSPVGIRGDVFFPEMTYVDDGVDKKIYINGSPQFGNVVYEHFIWRFTYDSSGLSLDPIFWHWDKTIGVFISAVDPDDLAEIGGTLYGFRQGLGAGTSGQIDTISLAASCGSQPCLASYSAGSSYSTEKPIRDLPPDPHGLGYYQKAKLIDLKEVPATAEHVTPGLYALMIAADPKSLGFTNWHHKRLYLFRIEERSDFFEIVHYTDLGPLQRGSQTNPAFKIVYTPIN